MRVYPLLVLLLAFKVVSAQYSSIGLNEKNIKRLAENSKNTTLFVVINNEKDPADAALVNAVKNYWKAGQYKFMSRTEYLDQKQRDALVTNNFYLCEWYEAFDMSNSNALFISASTKKSHSGVYILSLVLPKENKPKAKVTDTKKTESINLKFDLSQSLNSNKDKVADGYFDLMIKYFNNELNFCQSFVSIKDVKKEDKDGIVYFGSGMTDIQSRDILLIKEQVTKLQPADKKTGKKPLASDAVAQFNPSPKNVYTVFPDDIKMALNKNDKQVLIYSNDMLISANDGAVIAATNNFEGGPEKKDGFLLTALGVLILSYAAATLMK